jgi:hypothetical protein
VKGTVSPIHVRGGDVAVAALPSSARSQPPVPGGVDMETRHTGSRAQDGAHPRSNAVCCNQPTSERSDRPDTPDNTYRGRSRRRPPRPRSASPSGGTRSQHPRPPQCRSAPAADHRSRNQGRKHSAFDVPGRHPHESLKAERMQARLRLPGSWRDAAQLSILWRCGRSGQTGTSRVTSQPETAP